MNDNKSNKKPDKSALGMLVGVLSSGRSEINQFAIKRVPPSTGVVVMSEQDCRCQISNKDGKVESCSNKLEHIVEEADSKDGEESDEECEDRL